MELILPSVLLLEQILVGWRAKFLLPAAESDEAVLNAANVIIRQFSIAMFAVGAKNIAELKSNKIFRMD